MFIVALLAFSAFFAHSANGLDCYVTDIESALNKELKFVPENCEKNLDKMTTAGAGKIVDGFTGFGCYKLVAEGDGKSVTVKGCIPKGTCNKVKTEFEKKAENGVTASCYECDSNLCNSAPNIQKSVFSVGVLALLLFVLML